MSLFPEKLVLDFQQALLDFNFVAGVAYKSGTTIHIPLYHSAKAWVCDCLRFESGEDWREAEIFPVRAEELGEAFAYLPATLLQRVTALGRRCDVSA